MTRLDTLAQCHPVSIWHLLHMSHRLACAAQVHCVKAAHQLLKLAREEAPFPAGLVLHSFLGPADLVKPFAGIQGCYFSISGHSLRSPTRAPGIISQVPALASVVNN